MNVATLKFNNSTPFYQAVSQNEQHQSVAVKNQEKSDNSNEEKDFFSRNKYMLAGLGAVALGGIIYISTRGRGKISNEPKTHFERLNCFGKKIVENLTLGQDGKILQKEIEAEGVKYIASYKEGKLFDIEGYTPRRMEDFESEQYSILKGMIDEIQSPLVVSRKWGKSTNYWLFDKTGEKVTQIEEIEVVSDAMYQYATHKLTKDNSFAYQIEDVYSPKDNIPFGEIFECFKKGLI